MFNFAPLLAETIAVDKMAFTNAIQLVRSIPCTNIRCRNAIEGRQHDRCERCVALDALEAISPSA